MIVKTVAWLALHGLVSLVDRRSNRLGFGDRSDERADPPTVNSFHLVK